MEYLIAAGLVLVLIVAVNLAKAEPMPEDMQDEDERLDRQEQVRLDVRWWEVQAGYRPRAMGDSLGDRSLSLIPTVEEQREQVERFNARLKRRPLASQDRPKASETKEGWQA